MSLGLVEQLEAGVQEPGCGEIPGARRSDWQEPNWPVACTRQGSCILRPGLRWLYRASTTSNRRTGGSIRDAPNGESSQVSLERSSMPPPLKASPPPTLSMRPLLSQLLLLVMLLASWSCVAGVNNSSCHWQPWYCKVDSSAMADSNQTGCKMARFLVCSDGKRHREQTFTAAEQKALGMVCKPTDFYCSVRPVFDPVLFPVAAWCPWESWSMWGLECTERAMEHFPELEELLHRNESGLWLSIRQRTCDCPNRPGLCGADFRWRDRERRWRSLAAGAAAGEPDACGWCSWSPWAAGDCDCSLKESYQLQQTKRKLCVCTDGRLLVTADDAFVRRFCTHPHVITDSCPNCPDPVPEGPTWKTWALPVGVPVAVILALCVYCSVRSRTHSSHSNASENPPPPESLELQQQPPPEPRDDAAASTPPPSYSEAVAFAVK